MKTSFPKTDRSRFHGVFAATVTPMKANEEIDFPRLAAFTDDLVRQGVHGLIPLGSTGEMPRITELLRRCGDGLGVFCGSDTIALESLMVGAIGWIGGVVNVLPKAHAKLYELTVVQKNYRAAQKLFFKMLPLLELMEGGGKYTQFVKAACGLAGHPVGPPRRPLLIPTVAERARLRNALKFLQT